MLANEVAKRTIDIQKANLILEDKQAEIITQNKELLTSEEDLKASNDKLQHQK